MKKLAPAIAALLIATPAVADLKKDVLGCSAITDGIKRLECFDRIAASEQKAADTQAAQELAASETPANWNVSISQSKIDDSKTVILTTDAKETVAGMFNRAARPWLVLRCLRNTTSAYINFDGLHMADIQGYGRVTFRVDKQKAFTRSANVSTDNKALGFWNGGSAIPFIKQLFGGSTLLIQATPFSESAVTFSMNIQGLEDAIKPLRETCNW